MRTVTFCDVLRRQDGVSNVLIKVRKYLSPKQRNRAIAGAREQETLFFLSINVWSENPKPLQVVGKVGMSFIHTICHVAQGAPSGRWGNYSAATTRQQTARTVRHRKEKVASAQTIQPIEEEDIQLYSFLNSTLTEKSTSRPGRCNPEKNRGIHWIGWGGGGGVSPRAGPPHLHKRKNPLLWPDFDPWIIQPVA